MSARPGAKAGFMLALRVVWLSAGLALLAWITARSGLRQIAGMLIDLRWSIVTVVTLYAGHQCARAAALTLCVAPNRALRFVDAVSIRLAGEAVEFLTFAGPLVSEPTKAMLLQQRGLDVCEGFAATLTEYLASVVAAALMAVAGVGYVLAVFHPSGPVRVASLVVLISMTVFVTLIVICTAARVPILSSLARTTTNRSLPRLAAVEGALIETASGRPRRLLAILSLEGIAQGLLGLELWTLVSALHLSVPLGSAILMEGATKFLNAGAFFIPGQVGVAEGTYAVIFAVFGLPAAAGVTISFARRIRNVLTALAGMIALTFCSASTRRRSGSKGGSSGRRFDDERRQGDCNGHGDEEHRDRLMVDADAQRSQQQDERFARVRRAGPAPQPQPLDGQLRRMEA
jgi:lysylphosphatidylglycerol synthase-like protein